MKGKITPRKIVRYVADIECACGQKVTYFAYETNKRRMMRHLPKHWNGWQLRLRSGPKCFHCHLTKP